MKNNNKKELNKLSLYTSTSASGEIVMIFQALIARQSSDARPALALARLAVATLRRHGADQVTLAVAATRFDVAVSILYRNKRKKR